MDDNNLYFKTKQKCHLYQQISFQVKELLHIFLLTITETNDIVNY